MRPAVASAVPERECVLHLAHAAQQVRQVLESVCDDVHHLALALNPAVASDHPGRQYEAALPLKAVRLQDQVRHAGLVLDGHEHTPLAEPGFYRTSTMPGTTTRRSSRTRVSHLGAGWHGAGERRQRSGLLEIQSEPWGSGGLRASALALWASCVAVAVVSSGSAWAWMTFQPRPTEPASPLPSPLTAKLHGEWKAISAEFDSRVRASFPIGSPEGQMMAELERQGFSPESVAWAGESEHATKRPENDWVCHKSAYVLWRTDTEGRLTSVRGLYLLQGSL